MNRRTAFFLIGLLLCFLAAAFIRINNNLRFAPACGYDASGHLSYIYQIKSGWGTPLANEGWSTFHPSLYYFIAASLWKFIGNKFPWPMHILFRLLSTLLNLGLAVLVVLSINLLWPRNFSLSLLGLCFVLFVPLHIYASSMIGNEQLAAFLISAGLYLLLLYHNTNLDHNTTLDHNTNPASSKYHKKPRLSEKPRFLPYRPFRYRPFRYRPYLAVLMGVVSGLALLSKYTGILLLLTIIICLLPKILFDIGHRREHICTLVVVLLVCLLISGSFYARNILFFGRPFALSQNYPCVAEVMSKQPPGERQWTDFLGFDLSIFGDPIIRKVQEPAIPLSRSRYVWTLVYSNFWFESFSHFFLLHCDLWRQKIGKLLLLIGIFPSLLLAVEFVRESFLAFKEKFNTPTFPLLTLFFLNLSAFIFFNLKTPHFSAGKASYFLASTLPLAIFMGRGAQRWMQRGRGYKIFGLLFSILLFGLSSAAFFLTYI